MAAKPTEKNENKLYKCKGCVCIFLTQADLDKHKHAETFIPEKHDDAFHRLHSKMEEWDNEDPVNEVKQEGEWRPSNRGQGFYCLAEKQDFLVKIILQQSDGTRWISISQDTQNEYRLSFKDGRPLWISKRPLK